MLDKKEQIEKLDKAVDAFLSLEAYQIPEFCQVLAEKGIYTNVNMSHFTSQPTGVPLATDDHE